MSLFRDIIPHKNTQKRKKEQKVSTSLDQIDLKCIDDPDTVTRKLLVDLEDFCISHYITTRTLFNLLIKKGIITVEEYKKEKEKIMKLQDINDLLTNLEIHKNIINNDMEDDNNE